MFKITFICILGVVLSSIGTLASLAFQPTKKTSESFWYENDHGRIVHAFLHGQPTTFENRGIADDVKFYLYNNADSKVYTEITPGCSNCMGSFVKGAPVVIMAHGFSSDAFGGFGNTLRDGFSKITDPMNLIFVDWSVLAASPWYERAANSAKPVGQYTGMLVESLVAGGYSNLADFHFLGHSLGAHVGNFVARNITIGKLPRITALDPALPLFGERPDEERIDPTDAVFVDVMHTAMGTLLDGGLAFTEPRGHADFYPNGGNHQPECAGNDAFGACSHSKCYEYFSKSVAGTVYEGCQCNSWEEFVAGCTCEAVAVMGYNTPTSAKGSFYLRT